MQWGIRIFGFLIGNHGHQTSPRDILPHGRIRNNVDGVKNLRPHVEQPPMMATSLIFLRMRNDRQSVCIGFGVCRIRVMLAPILRMIRHSVASKPERPHNAAIRSRSSAIISRFRSAPNSALIQCERPIAPFPECDGPQPSRRCLRKGVRY